MASFIRIALLAGLVVLSLVGLVLARPSDGRAAGGSYINTLSGGQLADAVSGISMVLDAQGNPVASYYVYSSGDMNVLHCNDPLCASGDESIVTVDNAAFINLIEESTALKLDSSGNPVVTYAQIDTGGGGGTFEVKVLHCNDPNCAGGNESITTPDTAGINDCCNRSWFTSLELDGSGNPIVAYAEEGAGLTVLHCNDVNCAGADESITTHNTSVNVDGIAMRLDASGNPVVAHSTFLAGGDIHVLHCNDVNCAGGNESLNTAATLGDATEAFVSMVLDGSGNPVISYNHEQSIPRSLVVVHCNDVNCAGANESVTEPDPGAGNGEGAYSSVLLDGAGNPIITYHRSVAGPDVTLMRCNDVNCAGQDETITGPDGTFCGPRSIAQALDAQGNSVLVFSCGGNALLKALHCPDVTCTGADPDDDGTGAVLDPDDDNDGCPDVREIQTAPGSETLGGRRSLKDFWDFFDVPPRDGSIAGGDIFGVLGRFGSAGDPGIDPLSAPPSPPEYHTAFDRSPSVGPNVWNLTPANGSIAATDIFAVLGQFNHACV
jgi:hypothetical protein